MHKTNAPTTLTACDTLPPPFVIFLDIDGVVYNTPNQRGVFQKVAELFPDYPDAPRYDNFVCSIAAAYFFDKRALQNLGQLITAIEKKRSVWIVISSSWRDDRTVDELRNTFFGIHDFSRYIVDKTPEDLPRHCISKYCSSSCHADKSYSMQCRASEIQHWLQDHPEISDYLVLDDYDEHLSIVFGERYIKTHYNELLTPEATQQALIAAWRQMGVIPEEMNRE